MATKTRGHKTYGMQQKQFSEESLQQCNPTSRNISNKQANLTPKAIREKKKKNKENPKLIE